MYIPLTKEGLVSRLLVVGQREKWNEGTIWAQARKPRYREIKILKKTCERSILVNGTVEEKPKIRIIHEPSFWLKMMQRYILTMILEPAVDTLPSCVHGCVPGRSTLSNAEPHVGARSKIHMDLRDFFPSVGVRRVYVLFHKIFKYETTLAWLLANLCCYQDHLPQGAPTSPMLANMVAVPMDWALLRLCRVTGATYTRYVDDLTFSFRRWVSRTYRNRFIASVERIAKKYGFTVNEEKTGAVTRKRRMSVTGIVVNDKLSTPWEFRHNLRAALHNLRREIPTADTESTAQGKLSYVRMVSPQQAQSVLGKASAR